MTSPRRWSYSLIMGGIFAALASYCVGFWLS